MTILNPKLWRTLTVFPTKVILNFLLACAAIFCSMMINAQVSLTFYSTENAELIQVVELKKSDSTSINQANRRFLEPYWDKGFALASVDSVVVHDPQKLSAYVYVGPQIKTISLLVDDSETRDVIRSIPSVNEKFLAKIPFRNSEIVAARKKILRFLENNGYPFARIYFENLQIGTKPTVQLKIRKGPQVVWKKINIQGDLKLSKALISNLIEIREGDLYSEEKFQKAQVKLSQMAYVSLSQAPQVAFYPDGAELYLFLSKREASSANGILGMQPNQNGKIVFTGDIQLRLQNVLSVGEQFHLVWRSLMPQTPQLNVGLSLPFLFKTKFGTEGKFHLYKRDTSFLEVKGNFGLRYFLGGNNFVRGFYSFENSSLLNGVANNPLFADGVSVRINGYGLGFERQILDYFPNPRSGMRMEFQTVFGTRRTFPLDDNNFTLAGSKSNVFRSFLELDYYIPVGKRSTIRLGGLAQFYYADTIFANEQIRFGGLKTLRGFDEEQLFATSMARLSVEYRFLLDQNSHLLVFFDQAIYENRTRTYYRDAPFGFGAGLSFGTKAGIFSLVYGLGSQMGNSINLRDGKIHVGYLAVF
jgi:outer membrane protein assembly factor BamA